MELVITSIEELKSLIKNLNSNTEVLLTIEYEEKEPLSNE